MNGILGMIKTLTRLIRTHAPKTFLISSAIGIIAGLVNTAAIALIHHTIVVGMRPRLILFWLFLGLCVVGQGTRILSQYLLWKGCLKSMLTLMMDLTARVVSSPLRRLEEIGQSRILTALERDIISLTDAVITIPILLLNSTVLLGCTAYLVYLRPLAALLFIVLIVVATSSTLFIFSRTKGIQQKARHTIDKLFEYYRAQLLGIKELQLNAERRGDFRQGLKETAVEASRLEVLVQTIYVGYTGWFQLLFLIPIGGLVFVATNFSRASVAEVGAYALVLLYMTAPINALSEQIQTLGRGSIAFNNIESLGLALAASEPQAEESEGLARKSWYQLTLEGLTHTFAGVDGQAPFTVGPVNLQFERGQLVFITGGNGSGKTTLGKLLCGLYLPDQGCISVDGVPVSPKLVDTYRRNFSAIFSDFYLFKQLFGLNRPEMEAAGRLHLRELQLDSKLEIKNGEFTTVDLSQGQKKRLALLIGRLENRDIYVFDEWAADQDQMFREYFYNNILSSMRSEGKTVFVISHDERYFHLADRIVKMEFGQVVSDTFVREYATAVS
jgi:putative ATP-binding cassette transporter